MSTKEEGRQILPQTVNEPRHPRAGLGSRIAARFAGAGLTEPLPELRGETGGLTHPLGGTETQLEPIPRRRDATE
ncbi:MAG: hypothetical protein Q7U52_05960 [Hydrogenophaga sp.]|uniref:hypothetical protein n=1 Tax=Hydrogenophaga sp. TaxID=1904254 RepID=UPI002727EB0A|nr:hypothetical protein [Hydrogenophaga sp.]MDO9147199.1 hypothetical protein [Hydrogenophaga sp.]MDP2163225.1 hypothetical protein [Hydrogenophaga sp.]MDP3476322.1 hypothetical protein [Hydrogenophaga sp.]